MHSYILCLSQKSDLTLENFSDVDLFEGAKTVNPFIDYVNINDNYSPKELANFIVNDILFLKLEGEKVFLDKAKCEQYLDDTMTNLSVKIDDYFKRTNFKEKTFVAWSILSTIRCSSDVLVAIIDDDLCIEVKNLADFATSSDEDGFYLVSSVDYHY